MLEINLREVEEKICTACKKANRRREEVTLIAVSKTKPVSMLLEAYDLGVRVFGENKVQELNEKYLQLPSDIEWHLIGHLQRNKVKQIIGKARLIHSVDSIRLAEAIEAEAAKKDITVDILIEVNVAEEDSKFGLKKEDALELSFLMALPAILGSLLLDIKDIIGTVVDLSVPVVGVGFVTSLIVGYLSINFFKKVVKKGSMAVFSVYLWTLSAVLLIIL